MASNEDCEANVVYSLRHYLPEAGMTYTKDDQFLSHDRRDLKVVNALKQTGYELSKSGIERAFRPMFPIATQVFFQARSDGKDLWDMLPEVQRTQKWARLLPEAVFLELFSRFVEARYLWEKDPKYPYFEYDQYCPIVFELVRFRKMVGDCSRIDFISGVDYTSWILTDAQIYNELAGGLNEDSDDEDQKPKHTSLLVEQFRAGSHGCEMAEL
ncbi:hypothetical protein GGS21DRAFT_493776 [Xylaria nigripes]|nr:hypothetical protein GGS21DRAFT_493776 [Xylaria nigripes]